MSDLYRVENIEGLGYVEPPSPDDGPPWPFADEMLHRMIDARVLVKVELDYEAAMPDRYETPARVLHSRQTLWPQPWDELTPGVQAHFRLLAKAVIEAWLEAGDES